ncbi:MAG: SgcJ/EcaC family oxidoreductase [Gemmatimonadetes bacterium]|nr:SgcJ/EcaC family oxidoreductase [Gemmatimonadota bacterium]
MTRTFLFTAACLALSLGCAPSSPAELTDADREAIRQYWDEVARNLSPEDNEAWANGFTEDAVLMFQDTPTKRGREVIRAWGEDSGETGSPVALSVSFSDIEIHGSGDWAWVTTNSTATFEGVEGPVHLRQLAVLERQPDGTWLTAAAHVSSNVPPPGN